jgi:transposase
MAPSVNHRRYEALRAFFVDGLTYEQAAARFGYTRWAMVNLVREYRAGKLALFAAPRKPGPPAGATPAKDRARGRVIELRRQGLSTYEISARLAAEGRPLNRTSVGEILAGEGFGRLLRGPAPAESISPATPGRDTRLPRAAVTDFGAWPAQLDTTRAGLLLVIPGLVNLDLPALVTRAGYPAPASSPRSAGCCRCWRSSSPAPGGSPTSMTCSPTRPRPCWRAWRCCPRNPR